MYIFYLTIFFERIFNLKDLNSYFRFVNPIHFFINKKNIFSDENLNKYLKLNTEYKKRKI